MPDLSPAEVKESLTQDQYRLYKLIWERFIASQMTNCVQNTIQVDILSEKSGVPGYIFKASAYNIDFDGFMTLYVEGQDTEEEKEKL